MIKTSNLLQLSNSSTIIYLSDKEKKELELKKNLKKMPYNIISEIMSFSNVVYRKQKEKIVNEIKSNIKNISIINQTFSSIWQYKTNNNIIQCNYINFCVNEMSLKTLQKLIKGSNKCFCCNTHCHYKPKSIKYSDFNCNKKKNINTNPSEKSCKCLCRSFSRIYWRAYHIKLLDNFLED